MLLNYTRFALALAALFAALGYGTLQWQVSGLRLTLYKSQREVESKAGMAAAARGQLKAVDERVSRLRSLTEEIGPAVVADILFLAQERGNASLQELVAKHNLSKGSGAKGTP